MDNPETESIINSSFPFSCANKQEIRHRFCFSPFHSLLPNIPLTFTLLFPFSPGAVGKDITTVEIKYVSTLKIDAISVKHVATSLLENSCRVMMDSDDALIVDDHPSESTQELRSGLPESEVSAPAGAEVKVAAISASPINDKSDSGVEVSVAATSASPSNDKLDSAVLDSFPFQLKLYVLVRHMKL
ncbi:hypothetical protein Tco_1094385 [Tanacetum coccineum]|uniref:Uncharacterized protein n=1 Tax=Tanacetum coccineum TaxID=301880 RepID=A0ABQ5IFJ2_9ASTR